MSFSNDKQSKWDSVKRYKLNKMINKLGNITGHGTELVTVYIPPRRPIYDIVSQLITKAGTASNIKSDLNRNHGENGLSSTVEHRRWYKGHAVTGLVIFCGAIPTGKGIGTEKIEIYSVVPPKAVQINLYRCDDHFWIEHLKDMMKDDKVIGILSLDTQEAGFGILTGDRWEVVESLTSGVAGKHRQGGQSARRFERLRDNELNEYYHRVADYAQKIFIDEYDVKGIIIGGPGPTKEGFIREEYLDYRLQNNVIAVLDSSYSGSEGVRELIDKVNDQGIMSDYRLMEEKKIVKRFISEVYSGKGLGIYGIYDVMNSLKNGFADLVIVNDDITMIRLEIKCNKCLNNQEKFIERNELMSLKQELTANACPNCGSQDLELSDQDIIEHLEELSLMSGSRLEVISGKTEEGAQLASLGKIGAIRSEEHTSEL